jgi:hypothetical protein
MRGRPVDLARVRATLARLDTLAREHPEAFADVPRIMAALRADGPTGREAAAHARTVLERVAAGHPEIATPEAREAWERTLAAIEGFDEPEDD